ncbi:MAG: hypothetical protein ACTSRY_01470 [Alphaproteobacteria bacterium]
MRGSTVGGFFAALFSAVLLASTAGAAPFDFIRIGDQDGFGFSPTTGLVAASGAPADTDGNGLLQQTEFLPSLNGNGSVATGSGDDFDNRSAAETADTAPVGGSGFTDGGSTGSKWTDISLSTSFSGPDFPDPAGPGKPNEPRFTFDFDVTGSDIVVGSTIFFNLIFGDYDVSPANVKLTFADTSTRTIGLSTQGGGQDGLIQAATTTLTFAEVFTANGGDWDGYVQVDFLASNEPYTAFDFVELSLDEIPFAPMPAPGGLGLLGLGLIGLGLARRRFR